MLPSAQLVKRIQRVTTDHGKELGIRLPTGSGDLRDGDILAVADTNVIVVSVLPTDVLVIAPRTIHEMGVVAHSLATGTCRPSSSTRPPNTGPKSWSASTTTPSRTTSTRRRALRPPGTRHASAFPPC